MLGQTHAMLKTRAGKACPHVALLFISRWLLGHHALWPARYYGRSGVPLESTFEGYLPWNLASPAPGAAIPFAFHSKLVPDWWSYAACSAGTEPVALCQTFAAEQQEDAACRSSPTASQCLGTAAECGKCQLQPFRGTMWMPCSIMCQLSSRRISRRQPEMQACWGWEEGLSQLHQLLFNAELLKLTLTRRQTSALSPWSGQLMSRSCPAGTP